MHYPKVSVVISTYDRPQRLDKALASVYAQTFGDFEVVVVDDCSPQQEEVRAVLEKWYAAFESRGVELIGMRLGENSGYQCMPKNKGVEMASQIRVQDDGSYKGGGDYIAYLDDDNTWRPNHLSVLVNAIEYSPANDTEGPGSYSKPNFSTDMVYSRVCYHYEEPALREKLKEKFGRDPYPDGDGDGVEWNPQALSSMNYVDTSSILHSKGAFWRLVRDTGYGWDEALRRFGDWNLVWRWAVHGLTGKLVNAVTMDYTVHAGSVQIVRPAIEVPVCLNYTQYQQMRRDRNQELLAVS